MIASRLLRRPRVVIVGFGDVAARTVPLLTPRYRVVALRRLHGRATATAASTSLPAPVASVAGDLDARRSLQRAAALAAAAFGVLYFAPPAPDGVSDPRTRRWVAAVGAATARRRRFVGIVPERASRTGPRGPRPPLRVVYASTSGVYGDCGGAPVAETRPVAPSNARAVRRVAAERIWRETVPGAVVRGDSVLRHAVSILRIPGIYAADRLPAPRLRDRMPALRESDDVYTNHIQADDLAAIAVRAMTHGRPQRLYHASDDSRLRMGDYFDKVADALQLPRPPRLPRAEAAARLSPTMWSFMRESRQLDNRRLHGELRVRLRFPDVDALLATLPKSASALPPTA